MIIGIGIDLVELSVFEKKIERPKFIQRYFSKSEQKLKLESLAGHFAAKEALFKALDNQKLFQLKYVNVVSKPNRAPEFRFTGKLTEYSEKHSIKLSITHSKISVVAVVIIESKDSRKE